MAAAAGGGGVDGTQCSNHPYRNTSSPGGICALCLQDKLGKLVSSSSSSFIPTSSTSPSPSLSTSSSTLTLRPHHHHHHHPVSDVTMRHYSHHPRRGSHFPFLLSHPKNTTTTTTSSSSSSVSYDEGLTPRRRGFWSFLLHLSYKHHRPNVGPTNAPQATPVVDERKVCRSRSIGCGSRSFSGFADCALRRVESSREGRRSTSSSSAAAREIVKHRARCGGLFGGFIIASSSSSSSSSSYWTTIGDDHNVNAKPNGASTATPRGGPLVHGRAWSWGRALASPMRVFTKPIITSTTTTTIKRSSTGVVGGTNSNGNGTTKAPNLANIPSLLSVR